MEEERKTQVQYKEQEEREVLQLFMIVKKMMMKFSAKQNHSEDTLKTDRVRGAERWDSL